MWKLNLIKKKKVLTNARSYKRHVVETRGAYLILPYHLVHNDPRKDCRTSTLLHIWRATPCMAASSSHQEPDDVNV